MNHIDTGRLAGRISRLATACLIAAATGLTATKPAPSPSTAPGR